ncbi:MAG TPA: hypothetical protein VIW26_15990 [Gemmatimonadales bacterium]|jgi:hypothetical protein
MSTFPVLAQAAAEYGATTARQMANTPARSIQQAVDDLRGYVSEHTLMVILGALVVFALLRLVFTAPRVR